jgi:hypothetical protein
MPFADTENNNMAGDWIKVEKTSDGKPEVLRIAELLHVHPTHAFGLCVQFWCWCDDQMTSGNALGVTYATLNSLLGHDGFCEALVKVGWLRTRQGRICVTNFDRHLSESSKKRALANKRKQSFRERSPKHANVPREEKKRRCLKEKRRSLLFDHRKWKKFGTTAPLATTRSTPNSSGTSTSPRGGWWGPRK